MAISFSQNYFRNSAGVQWEIMGRLSLDNSYPAGGYLLDPAQFGLSQITSFTVNDCQGGFVYDFNATTQKLMVYTATAGGGVFVGDPAVLTGTNAPSALAATADAQAFAGVALAGHSHNAQLVNITGTYATWRIYHGAVVGGPFVVGETVTDGGGGSATVSAVGAGYLDFSAYVTVLLVGNPLTGGTSGATAPATSSFLGVITPPSVPLFLNYGYSPDTGGGVEFGSLVPIPSTSTIELQFRMRWNSGLGQIEVNNGGIDGGGPNDDYAIDYTLAASTSVSAGTPAGTNSASAVTGTAAAQIWTQGPYTPSGTIVAGGAGLTEVAGGTNLSAVTNVEYRVVGL